MKWVPSIIYTINCIGSSLLVSFICVGGIAVLGHFLGYQLNETTGTIAYIIIAVFIFIFLICIPEDTEI